MPSPVERFGLMAYLFVMYGGIPDTDLFSAAYGGELDRSSRTRRLRVVSHEPDAVKQPSPGSQTTRAA
jgi:hypothetical protein